MRRNVGQPIFRDQFEQALFAAFDGHALGEKIALALDGRPHVGQDQIQQRAIHAAAAHQQHRRNANAFLINLARQGHRTRAHAPDVGVMRAIRYVKRRLAGALQKHARDRGDIGKMRAAAKGIVQNRDVAGRKIECLRGVLHRQRHGAQVHGHVIAHRHRFARGIVNGAGIIAAFFDVRRKRRLAQHRAHLLGDGDQQVPKQFQLNWIRLLHSYYSLQLAIFTRKLATFCQRLFSDFSIT